jgi:hypothetical protein
MGIDRKLIAALAFALALAPGAASARHRVYHHSYHHHASRSSSWDGRWAGAWGGNDPTAINVRGGRVVSYEYGGATNPVGWSRVTAKRVVYGESNIVVTMTRTGPNTAHATIKTGQGNGTAELRRR